MTLGPLTAWVVWVAWVTGLAWAPCAENCVVAATVLDVPWVDVAICCFGSGATVDERRIVKSGRKKMQQNCFSVNLNQNTG